MRLLLILSLFMLSTVALAQDPALPPPPMDDSDLPELQSAPPPTVESTIERDSTEPEIRIIERKDKTITEYSRNGRVYMVRIEPRHAPPYYLIDRDGDGDMESRQDELIPGKAIPTWVIKSW